MSQVELISGKIVREENNSLINVIDACESIFFATTLQGKLCHFTNVAFDFTLTKSHPDIAPSRPKNLLFSGEKSKFPKDHEFKLIENRARALHFFANHELLAIEVMAKMILTLPGEDEYKKEIWQTLIDEQRHLALYINRLQEMGFSFGDFPVNDFFWKIFSKVKNLSQYFSLMALTFESANLDFSFFYSNVFATVSDHESSKMMKTIYNDEMHHVKLGVKYLIHANQDKKLWDAYVDSLVAPITPARSKGIHYKTEHRVGAGFPADFIKDLTHYKDTFKVTERRR